MTKIVYTLGHLWLWSWQPLSWKQAADAIPEYFKQAWFDLGENPDLWFSESKRSGILMGYQRASVNAMK